MSLFTDLREVFTAYAQRIKGLAAADEQIKADLGIQTGIISKTPGYYVNLTADPVDISNPSSSTTGLTYAVVDCSDGDKFVINAAGAALGRAWGFLDSSNHVLSMADQNVTVTDLELTAPTNAVKLVINDKGDGMSYKVGNNLATKASNGLSDEVKEALLDCFKHVAWMDTNDGACYDALVEALNFVDFYNTWVWDSSVGNIAIVKGAYNTNQNADVYPSRVNFNGPNQNKWNQRRTIAVDRGRAPAYYDTGSGAIITGMSPYYPIPIPANANHVKVTMVPSGQFMFMHTIQYADGVYGNSIEGNRQTWTQLTNGVFEKNIINPGDLFLVTNFKYDSEGTTYPVEPSYIKIEFSEV